MNHVNSIFQSQTEVKKSKFISFLLPYDEFKTYREELHQKHPKANHIAYAYRYLNEYNQIVENSSDDGEPKGAAGAPTLSQIRGSELINCALLTVRYFGGVKLGIGEMVRAYGSAAKAVIKSAQILPYEALVSYRFSAPYNKQRQIEYHLKIYEIENIRREYLQDGVAWSISCSQSKLGELKKLLV